MPHKRLENVARNQTKLESIRQRAHLDHITVKSSLSIVVSTWSADPNCKLNFPKI